MTANFTHPAMSSSIFWASKADAVKSPCSASPTFPEPSPKSAATSPKLKKGLVFKPVTNGAVQWPLPAPNSRTSWADSEADDDFLASLGARKDPAVAALGAAVSQKDARIEELEVHVGTSTLRIEQLEASNTEKDARISDLEAAAEDDQTRLSELNYFLKEKDARILDMEKDSKLQYSHVHGLVAEVDEQDRLITELEKELDNRGSIIRGLKALSEPLTPASTNDVDVPDVGDALELATDVASADEPVKPELCGSSPSSFEVVEETPAQREVKGASTPAIASAPDPPMDASDKVEKAAGPTFGNADFPVFVTRETLKVVPPAPAPKKLTFPINWDKYNKKPVQLAPAPTEKKFQPHKHGRADTTRVWGLAAKAKRDPTAEAPQFNPSLDIRQMTPAKRLLYANGPEVTIEMGGIKLGSLPKFMLMQCSGKAYKHFTTNLEATSFDLPADSMDVEAAKLHINWMDEMTYQGRVYSVTLNTDVKHDLKNLRICRAARVLGLTNTYIGHFTKQLCDRIRNNEAAAEFMDLICTLAMPENDPILDCLANNLANQRARKAAEFDADVVAKLEAKYPALAKKMATITARLEAKQKKDDCHGSTARASSSDSRYTVIS